MRVALEAQATTARFYRYNGPCIPISKHLIVKASPFVHLTEATTLRFIAENTSVPVPHVHCAFVHRNRAYIVMERIQEGHSIFAQLQRMLQEMRKLAPPGTRVESCVGSSLRDSRISRSRPRFGPFKSIQDFHLWLREDLRPEEHPTRKGDQDWKEIKEMVAMQDRRWPPPVFTHGDLNPFNILVRGDQVLGIYTSVWHGNRVRQGWQDVIPKFLDPWAEELRMEIIRQKWWGDF
ncbi:hypothetical protein QBC33DRAFT_590695 [Phialemonium atrogriseum]|uniref:Aminoglycoside phosphotransferase domain-containing protein n=1 Tax=Phialemonium atrogriseum TaxID=1093897 RepID=A0AAJ0FFS0_9PEZI|nr:uncharacterized protein QBC33DRAFT_590695 [Phialemonium atrogriseum]KAK1765822.1 hypothetical protein QBC33DRAFT_590695 [Phialemonium atrogriseum]